MAGLQKLKIEHVSKQIKGSLVIDDILSLIHIWVLP